MAAQASNTSRPNLQLPPQFEDSYKDFELYPANILLKNSYEAALQAQRARLDDFSPRLFTKSNSIYVPIREFTGVGNNGGLRRTGNGPNKIIDDNSLKRWLGDATPSSSYATVEDPKCRFIFINGDSSRDPLNITRQMLLRILSYHQVNPAYLDFLFVFGSQNEARGLRFSGFHEQMTFARPSRQLPIPSLRRSGRQYQLTYNLKSVARKMRSNPRGQPIRVPISEMQWSIRQAAIHHQFDVEIGTTLWIVTQGNLDIFERVVQMTAVHGRKEDRAFADGPECFRTSLTTHLLYCYWSIEEWRWYIQWLEDVIDTETGNVLYSARGIKEQHEYRPQDIQSVQYHEDRAKEAIMVLETNTDVLISIRDFYIRLMNPLKIKDFDLATNTTCQESVNAFATKIDDMISDSRMQIARAKLLTQIAADRKNLIIQFLQGQATEKMEGLTRITVKISQASQREAIAMRIITVVTLLYLPATFVSTFFSTDIIKYQNPGGGDESTSDLNSQYMGSFSQVAMDRWLQVTVPLTILTILGAGYAFYKIDQSAKRDIEKLQ
ncbi:hypothetical protein GLAREA_07776 [Glarea lozoyensis ATCC 20868]|uniref:CorA-like transporter domain-containing protein n=1 Tax=Glarea lozoyensis (strain ATCC 20868 / MF5171) TaxID=1116229 RepID=S3D279_GLAL2|nr:uncharacterized protein GLAREA_07776 [Glarea lozoyensis ATCC 20868]EPE32642.1 hypothetical protein GLAREA_07776 [Glarea lozoyensis ATCC 20868]